MVLIIGATALGGTSSLIGASDWYGFLVVVLVYSFLATRVSLRWYYVGWFLVPIVGIYALWKISWRVAYLPWRDWDLRPGEEVGPYDIRPTPQARRREDFVQVRTD